MDYREHADQVRHPEPGDPVAARWLFASEVPAGMAMDAVFRSGADPGAAFKALFSQGMEEGLAFAEAYPNEARLLLAWIDRHIWPDGVPAGRQEALDGWAEALGTEVAR